MGKTLYLKGKPVSMRKHPQRRHPEDESTTIDCHGLVPGVEYTNSPTTVSVDVLPKGKIKMGGKLGRLSSVLNDIELPKKRSDNIRFNI